MMTHDPSDGPAGIDIEIDPPDPAPFETRKGPDDDYPPIGPEPGRCPSCGDSYDLPTAVCRACAEGGACTVCAGAHRATQCPEAAQAYHAPAYSFPFRWSGTARRWLLERSVYA